MRETGSDREECASEFRKTAWRARALGVDSAKEQKKKTAEEFRSTEILIHVATDVDCNHIFSFPPISRRAPSSSLPSESDRSHRLTGAPISSVAELHEMPPRRQGPLSSVRRRPSKNSTSVVARIEEQQKQQKFLEQQEQQQQHQRSLAAALTAREVDADDDSDYGIELDDSVSGRKGQERRLPPNRRRNSIIVRYCFFRIVCRRAHQSFTLFLPLSLSDTHNPHDHAT